MAAGAARSAATASVAVVTGAQVANLVCLAAARDRVLAVGKAVRILGLGESRMIEVAADDNARMRPDALADALAGIEGSAIVCAGR